MNNDGETKVVKPIDPVDKCPRMIGAGKHFFHWKDFGHSNIVYCINCGQERDRTMTSDTVTLDGAKEYPGLPV